jgi:hypothetical protein
MQVFVTVGRVSTQVIGVFIIIDRKSWKAEILEK